MDLGCIDSYECEKWRIFHIFRDLHDFYTSAPLWTQNLNEFRWLFREISTKIYKSSTQYRKFARFWQKWWIFCRTLNVREIRIFFKNENKNSYHEADGLRTFSAENTNFQPIFTDFHWFSQMFTDFHRFSADFHRKKVLIEICFWFKPIFAWKIQIFEAKFLKNSI